MRRGRWVERVLRRSRGWSPQTGIGGLQQVIGELLALGAELAEAGQERWVRAARRVGIAHCEVELYPETGSEERLPGVPGVPSLRTPWSDPRSSSACAPSTDGPRAGPVPSRSQLASGSCCAPI